MKHDARSDTLRQWKNKGVENELLEARLQFTDAEGFHRYASMLVGLETVFPDYLPTQASGRWSITKPPLNNFPPTMDNCIQPKKGHYWLKHDLEGIEGRIGSAYMKDQEDLDAFNKGWDVHTITACRAWNKPLPPILTKACHKDPSCAEWRASWDPVWEGKDDRRRHLAKITRYGLQYAPIGPMGHLAILSTKDVEKQGLDRKGLVEFAKQYLLAKPILTNFKTKLFKVLNDTSIARTFLGRRRRLYGEYMTKGKEGWAFMVSGSVSDMMNIVGIAISNTFPEAHMIKNGHDEWIWSFPESMPVEPTLEMYKSLVNRTWKVNGVDIYCPGEFYFVNDKGEKSAIKRMDRG